MVELDAGCLRQPLLEIFLIVLLEGLFIRPSVIKYRFFSLQSVFSIKESDILADGLIGWIFDNLALHDLLKLILVE
jgi:hypothetical protein